MLKKPLILFQKENEMKKMRVAAGDIELQTIEYEKHGDAVLFMHFGGGNLMMWEQVVPFFRDHYHVVLVDLRGHGKSNRSETGYHIDVMADDMINLLRKLEISRTHVVGSSMGAEVGLSMAALYPQVVLSLVCEDALFDESGPYGLWESTQAAFEQHAKQTLAELHARPIKEFASIDEMVVESRHFFEERGWWSDIFEKVVRYDALKTKNGSYVKSWDLIAEEYTKNYLFYRFEDYYKEVQCPLLMMPDTYPGQSEREVEVMNGFLKLVANGKITYVPEWVHPFGWMLTPEGGSKAVLNFLDEI